MQPLQFLVPVDQLAAVVDPVIPHVAFVLVLLSMATRFLGHRKHVQQVKDGGEDALSRYLPHTVVSGALVVTTFLYLIVEPHAGMVLTALVMGAFVADFFEFEARRVEARNDRPLDRPNGALTIASVALLYAAFQSIFFIIAPLWNAVI